MAASGRRLSDAVREVPERLALEMGYTRAEFLATLDAAFGPAPRQADNGRTVEVPVGGGRVSIRLGDDRQRRIASLVLPLLEVDFHFEGLDPLQRRRFYEMFQRSFHKGGG